MNPYRRKIPVGKDGLSDIYDVLTAFNVTCPATQHALKKLLLPGVRTGGKSRVQDLEEAVQAIQRAVELAEDAPATNVFGPARSECGHPRVAGELYCAICQRRELYCPPKGGVVISCCNKCGRIDGCDCPPPLYPGPGPGGDK